MAKNLINAKYTISKKAEKKLQEINSPSKETVQLLKISPKTSKIEPMRTLPTIEKVESLINL
jgi:hypothetical protein